MPVHPVSADLCCFPIKGHSGGGGGGGDPESLRGEESGRTGRPRDLPSRLLSSWTYRGEVEVLKMLNKAPLSLPRKDLSKKVNPLDLSYGSLFISHLPDLEFLGFHYNLLSN